jgi:hypothetical protein
MPINPIIMHFKISILAIFLNYSLIMAIIESIIKQDNYLKNIGAATVMNLVLI